MVCSLRLSSNFWVRPVADKNFFAVNFWENANVCVLLRNNYGQAPIWASILREQLQVQVIKLKYKTKLLECKLLKYKSSLE